MTIAALVAIATGTSSQIGPADPRILYVGRFSQGVEGTSCQWPASEVRLRLNGRTLKVSIAELGKDLWQIVVDRAPREVLAPTQGTAEYSIDAGSAGIHTISLVKRTEAFVGTTGFTSFETPGGKLESCRGKGRHLEVVGDSISCGYGNEGANQNERFKPETENAYMSYASIAARELDADVDIIAWSGRKMWPDNTMPEIYDSILPTVKQPVYEFTGPAPDAVVINLATNDFGVQNPDETHWTGAYEEFIRRIWSHYPKARVYAAIGSMMTDNWPPKNLALTTLRGYLQRMVARINDKRLGLIEFDQQKMDVDGIGSDWHPSVKTHQKMGDRLAERLRKDLRW